MPDFIRRKSGLLAPHRRVAEPRLCEMLSIWHLSGGGVGGGYSVPFSGDWESSESDRMTRTPGAAGNRKLWTFGTWFYLESNGARMGLIGENSAAPDCLEITSANKLQFFLNNGLDASLRTSGTLSTSTWYWAGVACDTAQGTASDRLKLYLGTLGTQPTEPALEANSYPALDYQTQINNTQPHRLGDSDLSDVGGGSNYFDGKMAETAFVNGAALTPSSFASGGYPIDLSTLTFGTNGFWLRYQDSGALGTDSSGNGNTWTNSGVSQSTVTPTS